jgi:hypothetical protein
MGERAGADAHVVERQALGVLRRVREGTTRIEQAALPTMYSLRSLLDCDAALMAVARL